MRVRFSVENLKAWIEYEPRETIEQLKKRIFKYTSHNHGQLMLDGFELLDASPCSIIDPVS